MTARKLPDQVGARLGDVSLHLGGEFVVILTAQDEPVSFAREHLGHPSSFRLSWSDGRGPCFPEPFADLS
jgi:hypothetical protein